MVGQHWRKNHLFPKLAGSNYKNYESHAGQVKRKVGSSELPRLSDIVKAATETWSNPRVIVNLP